ncbi:KAP family P-loop NTPase fold protein [Burkholderia pseudomultivorans]|uniref:KAP family P-loop NTPase fold protein n=1 Tax=Burkholderia pseudomultivorans TaxID=1207504 RepID=UPI0009BD8D1F|nr:P-loop NTPase fold protein [Burkholderia pseudomultivorans]
MNSSVSAKANSSALTLPHASEDVSTPFSGDQLGRGVLATQLSDFILRLGNGAVIAIDSQWGGGKTWFGRNWAAKLTEDGHKVAFINAFEQDYTEDPFLLIAAELSALLDSTHGQKKRLLKKAAAVAVACLPVTAKAVVSAGSKFVLGNIDLPAEFEEAVKKAESKSEEFVQHWVERKLENYKKEQESLASFRAALAQMAATEDKPVVVFVDELDRCRPDFAVRLIERIKHFFETPNVVFVLLIHREQLNRAIAGVYGQTTDGAAYLSKFVHFFFALQSKIDRGYIGIVLDRFGCSDKNSSVYAFSEYLSLWQSLAELTLRDVERACALYAYARLKGAERLLAYLVTLKIKRPDIFVGMLQGSRQAFLDAPKWFGDLQAKNIKNGAVRNYAAHLAALSAIHDHHINGIAMSDPLGERYSLNDLGSDVRAHSFAEAFTTYARQIDLPID